VTFQSPVSDNHLQLRKKDAVHQEVQLNFEPDKLRDLAVESAS
jgi:hypothetical protein